MNNILLIYNINKDEEILLNNITINMISKSINLLNIDVDIKLYEKIIYIYDINLINNDNNLDLINDKNVISYQINNIINIDNILFIINLLNYDFSNHYHIYNESIVSNSYYIKNENYSEYKSQYLFNPFRLFDKNGNYINSQSYVFPNEYISINIDNINSEKICFYIDNSWSFNHHCQFMELFPMMILCKIILNNNNYENEKIDFFMNYNFKNIYEELFDIFDINNSINKIYFKRIPDDINEYNLYYRTVYNFGINHLHRMTTYPLLKIFTEYIKYNFKYKSMNTIFNNNGVSLLRDINNKNNTWFERCIVNQNELINLLKDNKCDIIHTEKMSLYEKFCNLSYRKYIIIEAGASLPNLYFIEKLIDTKIIIICNENMYNFHGIYEDQVRYYYENVNVVIGSMEDINQEKSNSYVNCPYIVNIYDILKHIEF